MTGYDKKILKSSHDRTENILFKIEVDVDHSGWKLYKSVSILPGQTITNEFPNGFSAHWVRLISNINCTTTAIFTYE